MRHLLSFLRIRARQLRRFPWRMTLHAMRQHFRADHLSLSASSLTFTTLLALVPLFSVVLAIFTTFPIFDTAQLALQRWLVNQLIPDSIARQVLGYLTQFSSKASHLGGVGLTFLLFTSLMLLFTVEQTFNQIWRVRTPRPLSQRIMLYWSLLTLGPLALGGSVLLSSFVTSASHGWIQDLPSSIKVLVKSTEFVVLVCSASALYYYVPHTPVRWLHAIVGGIWAVVCLELGKKLLGLYLWAVPTYSIIYGAFATVPILLLWIYIAWVIVLLGAVITAYLPNLRTGIRRPSQAAGWEFSLAVEVLQKLYPVRFTAQAGLSLDELSQTLRAHPTHLETVLEHLKILNWVGQLQEIHSHQPARYVLLADTETPLTPLVERVLLHPAHALRPLYQHTQLERLTLADVLQA